MRCAQLLSSVVCDRQKLLESNLVFRHQIAQLRLAQVRFDALPRRTFRRDGNVLDHLKNTTNHNKKTKPTMVSVRLAHQIFLVEWIVSVQASLVEGAAVAEPRAAGDRSAKDMRDARSTSLQ